MATFLDKLKEVQSKSKDSIVIDHDTMMMNILKPAILDKIPQFKTSLMEQAKLLNPVVNLFITVDIKELITTYFDSLAQMSSIRSTSSPDPLINKQTDVEHYYKTQCDRLVSIKKLLETEFSGLDVCVGIGWSTSQLGFEISGKINSQPEKLVNEPARIQAMHLSS